MERSTHAMAAIAVIGISLTGVSSAMALAGERSEIEAGVRARTAIDGDRDHKVVAVEPKKVVVARVVASKPAAPKVDIAKVVAAPKVVMAPEIDPASAASGLTLLLGSGLVALGRRRQTETLG